MERGISLLHQRCRPDFKRRLSRDSVLRLVRWIRSRQGARSSEHVLHQPRLSFVDGKGSEGLTRGGSSGSLALMRMLTCLTKSNVASLQSRGFSPRIPLQKTRSSFSPSSVSSSSFWSGETLSSSLPRLNLLLFSTWLTSVSPFSRPPKRSGTGTREPPGRG